MMNAVTPDQFLTHIYINMTVAEALEWLAWFTTHHKLSWRGGEEQRLFAVRIVEALQLEFGIAGKEIDE